jgi:hypothetical protein
MTKAILGALLLGAAAFSTPAAAQQGSTITQTIAGTRLDVSATGEVTRVPDVAIISAGVVTRSTTATGAIQDAAARMSRVLAALKRAGVEERDVQTSNISLNPEYRYPENQAPVLVGYTATNQLTIRFRDIRNSGKILDALVAEGANQVNGPNMTIDKPEAALDEARANAVAAGRARRPLCALARPACRAGRFGLRERRLRGAAADAAGADDGPRRAGFNADRARRAEAPGHAGDDVRTAMRSSPPRARQGGTGA